LLLQSLRLALGPEKEISFLPPALQPYLQQSIDWQKGYGLCHAR